MAEASDAGEDGFGGFGADEGLRVGVGVVDVVVDRGFEIVGSFEGAALQALAGGKSEPAFDKIEPRGGCRGEVQVPAWALHQPVVDQLSLVSGGVVEHEMDVEVPRHARLDLIEVGAELNRTMPTRTTEDHGPRPNVEGGEQVGRTLAAIVVIPAFWLAGLHRQHRGRAGQRLDLGLLVHAPHDGPVRRGMYRLTTLRPCRRRRNQTTT